MSAKTMWNTALTKLAKWLWDQGTAPGIGKHIIQGLGSWCNSVGPNPSTHAQLAWSNQQEIGWDCMLDGRVALQWHQEQAQFWTQVHSQKSSLCWTLESIKKWNIV